ncbi:hypothetical protein ACS0TY_024081 [Phlomoides rotata]
MASGCTEESDEGDVLDLGVAMRGGLQKRSSAKPCLVGKLITGKTYNMFALICIMKKAFKPKKTLSDILGSDNPLISLNLAITQTAPKPAQVIPKLTTTHLP